MAGQADWTAAVHLRGGHGCIHSGHTEAGRQSELPRGWKQETGQELGKSQSPPPPGPAAQTGASLHRPRAPAASNPATHGHQPGCVGSCGAATRGARITGAVTATGRTPVINTCPRSRWRGQAPAGTAGHWEGRKCGWGWRGHRGSGKPPERERLRAWAGRTPGERPRHGLRRTAPSARLPCGSEREASRTKGRRGPASRLLQGRQGQESGGAPAPLDHEWLPGQWPPWAARVQSGETRGTVNPISASRGRQCRGSGGLLRPLTP